MGNRRHAFREGGFTLIEIAFVLIIITIMLGAVLKGQSVIVRNAEVQSIIGTYRDISTAVRAFKERYQYLPGDFPVNAATPEIAGVRADCLAGGANGGNGNGRIDGSSTLNESACVPEHLIRSGFLTGDPVIGFTTQFGSVRVVRLSDSSVQPVTTVTHVVEFFRLPCDVAKAIDVKLDDGYINSGSGMASVSNCATGDVVSYALPLK